MKFILISDAVRLTGLDRQTIRNWIDKGIIPAKKINGTFYLEQGTLKKLAVDIMDTDNARKNLNALCEKFRQETDTIREMRKRRLEDHHYTRLMSFCVNTGIRTGFFDTVLGIMMICDILTQKETEILSQLLNGDSLEEVSAKHNLNRERIRQIAEKAIRKSTKMDGLSDSLNRMSEMDAQVKALEQENSVLKKMLYSKAINTTESELSDTEKRLVRMGRHEFDDLLSRKLNEMDISIRALNCLANYRGEDGRKPIRTIGDLCRLTEDEYMNIRNAGKKTLDELTRILGSVGLTWGMDIEKILSLR